MLDLQTRALPAPLDIDVEAHIAEGIIVPYGRPVDIVEARDGGLIRYVEEFVPGALERAKRVPHRVGLMFTHDESLANRLGHAVEFTDEPDGMRARFQLDRSIADRAIDVLSTSHKSLSIAFRSIIPKAYTERAGDVVRRRSVHLFHVAGVTEPAYAGARVLNIRHDDDDDEPTAAELADAQQRAEADAILAEARELIAAGAKWARPVDGRLEAE